MSLRLGVLTIGQAPRDDLVPEIRPFLGSDVMEAGALDHIDPDDLDALRALEPEPGDGVLVTLLRNGRSVTLAHSSVVPLVQRRLEDLESAGTAAVLLVCTGDFPDLRHRRPLLQAGSLLRTGVDALAGDAALGILVPSADQVETGAKRWSERSRPVLVQAASPYAAGGRAVAPVARRLATRGAELLVLDCVGYTLAHASAAHEAAGVPVLTARSVVSRLAGALVEAAPSPPSTGS